MISPSQFFCIIFEKTTQPNKNFPLQINIVSSNELSIGLAHLAAAGRTCSSVPVGMYILWMSTRFRLLQLGDQLIRYRIMDTFWAKMVMGKTASECQSRLSAGSSFLQYPPACSSGNDVLIDMSYIGRCLCERLSPTVVTPLLLCICCVACRKLTFN